MERIPPKLTVDAGRVINLHSQCAALILAAGFRARRRGCVPLTLEKAR
jgi:hypothetical protein